jgi:hypothetical protein
MTRKFARNVLEELFQGIEELERRLDALENNHEKTGPFRDKDHFPPGVEGQIVIAEWVPPE